ncbi:heat shock protein 70 [Rhizophagus diaphanus]|nr:heat shock protein 70 [Rhizophagus diaphanus] [Rhizophagus sp. MUCL 43196]
MAKEYIIGIDLGNSFSSVSVWHEDNVIIIPNDYSNRITPSYVAFTDSEILVGDAAKIQSISNCRNTVFDIHRLLGRDFYHYDIQYGMKYWPFNIVKKNKEIRICVNYKWVDKEYTPEEILSFLLNKMKKSAETFLGVHVKKVVVALPIDFNISQYQAVKKAALLARLNIIRIVNSPTAAAITYGLRMKVTEKQNILVFDFGGGTCSASLITLDKGIFKVKAVVGNNNIGGKDLDDRLVYHFAQEYKNKNGQSQSMGDLCRLRTNCERAKIILSNFDHVHIDSFLYDIKKKNFNKTTCSLCNSTDDISQYSSLDRDEFEKLNDDIFYSVMKLIKKVIDDAKIIKSQVHEIVLVGGSTRIPIIQDMIKKLFNGKDLIVSINPDEAAAHGAAVQATILSRNTSQRIKDIFIHDVNASPFNIMTSDSVITPFIERNTVIPIKKSKTFKIRINNSHQTNISNYLDRTPNKKAVQIKIYEGESYHYLIGEFELPISRNTTDIEVTFDLSYNFKLKVSAVDNQRRINKKYITINY